VSRLFIAIVTEVPIHAAVRGNRRTNPTGRVFVFSFFFSLAMASQSCSLVFSSVSMKCAPSRAVRKKKVNGS
jgi:hypothetical protein